MGRPLVGKQAMAGFFGTGWRKVTEYITLGAAISKGNGSNSTYEADQKMLENWWKGHIQKKLAVSPFQSNASHLPLVQDYKERFEKARIGESRMGLPAQGKGEEVMGHESTRTGKKIALRKTS